MTRDAADGPPTGPDRFLSALVQVLEASRGNWVGVTLSVKGLVVSGVAVSSSEYLRGVAAELREAGGQDGAQSVAEALEGLAGTIDQARDTPETSARPEFIHLKNARILAGSQMVPPSGMWWRARLSEVDGFTVGLLSLP
jgi:hypothetical protein